MAMRYRHWDAYSPDGDLSAPDMAEADDPVRWETGQPLRHAIDARRDHGTMFWWFVNCSCGEWQECVNAVDRAHAARAANAHLAEVGE